MTISRDSESVRRRLASWSTRHPFRTQFCISRKAPAEKLAPAQRTAGRHDPRKREARARSARRVEAAGAEMSPRQPRLPADSTRCWRVRRIRTNGPRTDRAMRLTVIASARDLKHVQRMAACSKPNSIASTASGHVEVGLASDAFSPSTVSARDFCLRRLKNSNAKPVRRCGPKHVAERQKSSAAPRPTHFDVCADQRLRSPDAAP